MAHDGGGDPSAVVDLPLARHFAARLAQRQGEVRRLTRDAEDQLKGYRWPGNVRALSAVIERAVMRRSREESAALRKTGEPTLSNYPA